MEKKSEKKLPETFGSYALKSLPLHPLLKTKAARVDILLSRNGDRFFFFLFLFASLSTRETTRKEKKRKIKKTSENIWKICFKVLTFAPAFREEADAESASLIEAALRTSSSFISLSQRETTRKRKKTFEIIWKIYLKVLTFASAF